MRKNGILTHTECVDCFITECVYYVGIFANECIEKRRDVQFVRTVQDFLQEFQMASKYGQYSHMALANMFF